MKRGRFVEGLSGQMKLTAALRSCAARGAAEASWVLAEGDWGFGKSRQLMRLAVQHRDTHVYLRAQQHWSVRAMFNALCEVLEIAPAWSADGMFRNILAEVMRRDQLTIILDEFQLVAGKPSLVEALRGITDVSECMLLIGANRGCYATLNRYQQVRSRIYEMVPFGPVTVGDVKLIVKGLSDVDLADDMVAHLHKETGGRLRDVLNALGRVDAAMKTHRGTVTLDAWGERKLLGDTRLQLVASNA